MGGCGPLLGPYQIQHLVFRAPKGGHNLDNHPHTAGDRHLARPHTWTVLGHRLFISVWLYSKRITRLLIFAGLPRKANL